MSRFDNAVVVITVVWNNNFQQRSRTCSTFGTLNSMKLQQFLQKAVFPKLLTVVITCSGRSNDIEVGVKLFGVQYQLYFNS